MPDRGEGSSALAGVTAAFGTYLDRVVPDLADRYRCRVRDVTDAELVRLQGPHPKPFTQARAVEPAHADSATLLVGRFEFDGGAAVRLAFGLAAWRQVPDSYGDAADVTSEDLIATASRFIHAPVNGCTEFCRPHERESLLDFLPFSEEGPLMEQGCETSDGIGWSRTGPGLGDPFERRWQPWPPAS